MDYPYVINFLVMLWLAYLYWRHPNEKYVKLGFLLQFIFIAFRAPVVGADTWNYIRYLDGERSFYNNDSRQLEIGFVIYREILVSLQGSRFFYMVINTFLTCFPVYLLIKRYSFNVPLSLAMLPIFNIYTNYFCALRQLLGLAILFLCMIYVLDNRKKKWFIFGLGTVFGYTFHTSIILYAIIFVGIFYLKNFNRKIKLITVIASAIVGIVLQSFDFMNAFNLFLTLNFSATERLENYLINDTAREVNSLFIALRPTIIAVLVFSLIDKDRLNHWFSNIYFAGIVINNLFISVPMINRITAGLFIFAPIVFTWIFDEKYKRVFQYRKIVNIIMLIFILYWGQAYIKSNLNSNIDITASSRMHPYQFIWEDYSRHPSIIYWD